MKLHCVLLNRNTRNQSKVHGPDPMTTPLRMTCIACMAGLKESIKRITVYRFSAVVQWHRFTGDQVQRIAGWIYKGGTTKFPNRIGVYICNSIS